VARQQATEARTVLEETLALRRRLDHPRAEATERLLDSLGRFEDQEA
jgi:hypothetical protein